MFVSLPLSLFSVDNILYCDVKGRSQQYYTQLKIRYDDAYRLRNFHLLGSIQWQLYSIAV